jgi:ATP-dependent helicase/nuclease subunit A
MSVIVRADLAQGDLAQGNLAGGDFAKRAEANQLVASDPAVSAFVAASAGSGKTKLLTDRLLRLMLAGADPSRIQCLTFTKAAAAEMSLRLQRMLGEWVTLSDAALDQRLSALNLNPSAKLRGAARRLFATVLDLPGGMRIGTIHAFCQSLLRRFPLEAALSPHFQLIEGADQTAALIAAQEDTLADSRAPDAEAALQTLAGLLNLNQFGELARALQEDRARWERAWALGLEALTAAQRRVLGVKSQSSEAVIADSVSWHAEAGVREAARLVAEKGSDSMAERAGRMLAWLALSHAERAEHWAEWRDAFLLSDGKPRALSKLVNPKLSKTAPQLEGVFTAEQARIVAVEDALRAATVAALSAALLRLAGPVAQRYGQRKAGAGWLDYADLVTRTVRLLVDPGAAWVLYKLDGGLDHLLLDEVQDTAPAQWAIAHALTAEFFAGAGAREERRTVFAVGDRKQSIYSFQGAEPGEFDRARVSMRARVEAAGETWREVPLDVSFRSAAPVLALVDAVFAAPEAAPGVVLAGETLRHYAHRSGHAGRVELWPLVPVPDDDELPPWTVADGYGQRTSAPLLLAEALADWIKAETAGTTMLTSRGRMLAPGDVLILVRRRNAFARALVRALKLRDVPVAGLDRMVLTAQPAVADLLALCDALLLPRDDLSLACVLTSPLGGLTDDSLMALALYRPGSLWEALRARAGERADWGRAWRFLSELLARVDYAAPHALLSEALVRLGGRAALFARLGPEAAEPIDELLEAALAYGQTHAPSLQGFVHWLRQSGAEVKREAEGAGDVVRVMTVHGAKGLQAPLVILPDTTSVPPFGERLFWATDPATGVEVPLWSARKELSCQETVRRQEAARAADFEEYHRELYVALTRAEDRLLICGHETRAKVPEQCWYTLIQRAMQGLGDVGSADYVPFESAGPVLFAASPQISPPEIRGAGREAVRGVSRPDWFDLALPVEPKLASPLAPSQPTDADLGPVPFAASPLAARERAGLALKRGQLVHALLQHLPGLPPDAWAQAAETYLARPGQGLPPEQARALAQEVLSILNHVELAPLFGPNSRPEVPLTGVVGERVVGGLVDRLAVLPDRVLLADYKTNRQPPVRADDTPVLYLRQMAAYRAVVQAIFPNRETVCVLIWTQAARVFWLPQGLLDPHSPSALSSMA